MLGKLVVISHLLGCSEESMGFDDRWALKIVFARLLLMEF